MIYTQMSAAKAVKARARASVQYNESLVQPVENAEQRKTTESTVKAKPAEVVGGKAMKTGMVLARARLPSATSGVPAMRDRQNAMLSKGKYRDAEKVGKEAPIGTLSTAGKQTRHDFEDKAEHRQKFRAWMKAGLTGKVHRRHSNFRASECHTVAWRMSFARR